MDNRTVLHALIASVLVTVGVSLWLAFRPATEHAPHRGGSDRAADPALGVAGEQAAPAGAGASATTDGTGRPHWRHRGDGKLLGQVVDRGTGRPFADLTVALFSGRAGPRKPLTTQTDDTGMFVFPRVPAFDAWSLTVHAPAPLLDATRTELDVRVDGTTDLGVIHLESGFAVEGIVVTEDGSPIAGALVQAARQGPGIPVTHVLTAVRELGKPHAFSDAAETGADGRFALRALPPGTCDLVATAPGYAMRWLKNLVVAPDQSDSLIRIVLPEGATLAGHVVHRLGGVVEGLTITAFSEDGMRDGFSLLDKSFTKSGENGAFAFESLDAEEEYWICVVQENGNRTIAEDVEIPPDDPLVIRIGGEATLLGTVTNEQGEPIEDAELVFDVDPGNDRMLFISARSAADGSYVIDDVPVEDLDGYIVTAEGYLPHPQHTMALIRQRRETRLKIAPGRNVFDFRMSRASIIRGVVVEHGTGEPVPGVQVTLLPLHPGIDFASSTRTDPEGAFELVGAENDHTQILLTKEGWAEATTEETTPGPDAPDDDKTAATEPAVRRFEMTRSVSVRGVVLSPDGRPVSGARVTLLPADSMNDRATEESLVTGGLARVLTDSAGRFELPGAGTVGQHAVHAFREGYLPARSTPLSGAAGEDMQDVEIRLRSPVSLHVTVTSPGGEPVPGASVHWSVKPTPGTPRLEPTGSWDTPDTGDDGTCRIEGLDTGTLSVTVQHRRYLSAEREGIATAEGDTVNLEIALDQGGVITGTVLGPDGEPFRDATLERRRGNSWSEVRNAVTEGRFELIGLDAGTVHLRARGPGVAVSRSVRATVGGPPVTIWLRRDHPIAGTVTFPNGTPAHTARVYVWGGDPNHSDACDVRRDGSFRIRGLPAGTYRVLVNQGRSARTRPNLLPLRLTGIAGGTLNLHIEVRRGETVSGQVFLADGTPARSGGVLATNLSSDGSVPAGKAHSVYAQIRDGAFEATGLMPGRVLVRGSVGSQEFEVTTTAGTDDVHIDLLATGGLRGRVIGPDGNAVGRFNARVIGPDGSSWGTSRSNDHYYTSGLSVGSYTVHLTHTIAGKPYEATATDVLISAGQTTTVQTLRLEPAEGPPPQRVPVRPHPAPPVPAR